MKWKWSLVLLFFFTSVRAQQFGGFPPSTRWKQIDTDTARIIFTNGADGQADRIATLVHRMARDTFQHLGDKLRKINVVLQSKTTLANGYVALAPFRSEYFLVPGSNVFDFGNLPWYENLAIHEYRHVQQYNNFRRGLSKGFYYLFGEGGQAFANALSVPDWFFEGDAVHAETALTPQGRGRLPLFLSSYNSLWVEGRNYNWMKLRNGSLKDYVPNHYPLGYLLVNYGYEKYGPDFWGKVTRDASAFKGLVYPFQQAIKRHSGADYKTFRKEAFAFYQNQLGKDERAVERTRTVNDYLFPQRSGDSLLYLHTAYNKLPSFYVRRGEEKKKISLRSISSEDWFSYRNGTIAYTAYSTHPRWSLVDYSDIVLLDVATGREQRITKKSRYYTPDLSPSGEKIVAVRINDSLETRLEVLKRDGTVVHSISLPYGSYFMNPRFVNEEQIVYSLRHPDARMSLQLLNLTKDNAPVLIPPSYGSIGLPFVAGDTIYFTAGFSGNDELYAYGVRAEKLYQLTLSKTGNYYASTSRDTVQWSLFTSYGMQLQKKPVRELLWQPVDMSSTTKMPAAYPVAEPQNILGMSTRRFAEKRYSKGARLFNFHSWQPNYVDPEFSLSLLSDNILNTFSNEVFYRYNQNETSHTVGWNTAYSGLYPVISAGVEYTRGRDFSFRNRTLTLDNVEASIGYNIPLNFTKGKSYKQLRFGSSYVFNRSWARGFFKDSLAPFNTTYLSHFVNWSHYLPMARQHIYPKLGLATTVQYRHTFQEQQYQFFNNSFLYLPWFGNHSIVLNGSFQQRDTLSAVFSNRFANARGFQDYNLSRLWKVGANYHFPLLYPDFGFANIVYLQRIRANGFYDFARGYSNSKRVTRDFISAGGEIFFDTKWWNQLPVTVGFRVSRLLTNGLGSDRKGDTYFEFILPVSLIPD